MTIYVLPLRKVLDGKGCMWESLLADRGWNELPDDKKKGRVTKLYSDNTIDVYFEELDYTCEGVFIDEVRRVE